LAYRVCFEHFLRDWKQWQMNNNQAIVKSSARWTQQPKCDSQTTQNRNYSGRQ
jgi:hypothetical protein